MPPTLAPAPRGAAPMSSRRPSRLSSIHPTPKEARVTTTKTTISRIGVVCVPISDQDRALEFYVGTLGFEKRADVRFGGGDYRWVEVAPVGADTTIAIAPPPPGKSAGGMETGICLHTSEIEALHAELKEQGVDVDAEISRMGDGVPPMFWLRDPEQNSLIVVENR